MQSAVRTEISYLRQVRDQAIPGQRLLRYLSNVMNHCRVNLLCRHQGPRFARLNGIDRPQENTPVLLHVLARILFGDPEIQAVSAVGLRYSSMTGAEPMRQPIQWL